MITKDYLGFSRAHLETNNHAHIHAVIATHDRPLFTVSMAARDDEHTAASSRPWLFNEEACREAAQYFTELANELARRKAQV